MDAEGVINLITPSDTCTVNLMERGVRHQFDDEIGRNADEFRDAKGQINLIYPLDTCVIKLIKQGQAREIRHQFDGEIGSGNPNVRIFSPSGCNLLGFFRQHPARQRVSHMGQKSIGAATRSCVIKLMHQVQTGHP